MLNERPNQADVISALTITETGDVIYIRGTVPDEATRRQLVGAAQKAARGKSVRDELTVGRQQR